MTRKHTFKRAQALLSAVPRPPREGIPPGLSPKQLQELDKRLGLQTPQVFKDWLRISNGPCIGPGGIFGINTERTSLNLESILETHPNWKERGWLPVAGDGTGNYYVLLCASPRHPVGFIDTMEDPDKIAFLVASTLPVFLELLLRKELGEVAGWPFDKTTTLKLDPGLQRLRNYRLAYTQPRYRNPAAKDRRT